MNTTVNFEIAKLLKEKGFNKALPSICFIKEESNYTSTMVYEVLDMDFEYILRPTIAEVVMWLYEKHGIWVTVSMENNEEDQVSFYYTILHNDEGEAKFKERMSDYNSPTEAYSEGITYTLENLIQGEV